MDDRRKIKAEILSFKVGYYLCMIRLRMRVRRHLCCGVEVVANQKVVETFTHTNCLQLITFPTKNSKIAFLDGKNHCHQNIFKQLHFDIVFRR